MLEDALDDGGIFDADDDLGVAAAGVTGFDERSQVIYQNTKPRPSAGFPFPNVKMFMTAFRRKPKFSLGTALKVTGRPLSRGFQT